MHKNIAESRKVGYANQYRIQATNHKQIASSFESTVNWSCTFLDAPFEAQKEQPLFLAKNKIKPKKSSPLISFCMCTFQSWLDMLSQHACSHSSQTLVLTSTQPTYTKILIMISYFLAVMK